MPNLIENLGEVKVGKSVSATFETGERDFIRDSKGNLKMQKSCGCFNVSLGTNKLTMKYKASAFPKHLKNKTSYSTTKSVTLYYLENNAQREMRFTIILKIVK